MTSGRAAGCGCLLLVALLVAAGWWAFPRIKESLLPQYGGPMVPTSGSERATVQRGDVTEAVTVYGSINPARQESLWFSEAEGEITLVAVEEGMEVAAGDLLVALDRAALSREVALLTAERDEAKEALAALAEEESPVRELALQLALDEARAELQQAEAELDAFDKGKGRTAESRQEALDDLNVARQRLASLRGDAEYEERIARLEWLYSIAEVEHGPYVLIENPSEQDRDKEWLLRNEMLARLQDLEVARLSHQMEIRAAEQAVAEAERTLRELDRAIALGEDDVRRQKLVAQVALAEAKVLEAEMALEGDTSVEDAIEVAKAEADLIKAEGDLTAAELALADAELVAPFAGTVLEVKAVEGAAATRGDIMVTLADTSSLHAIAQVSELDIGSLEEGMAVDVVLEAFGEAGRVPARLGALPRYGTYQDGVTWFQVPVYLEEVPPGLRIGMGARISVPVGVATDVLYLPAHAVQTGPEGSFVFVEDGEDVQQRTIRTGVSDGVRVEIIEGLEEGETVVVPTWGPGLYRGG
ncbi:MAG: efflux RND transporter periplasmic adaptor subunit [Anaerolineae bacterium]